MESKYILVGVGVLIVLVAGYLLWNSGAVVSAQGLSELTVQPDEASVYLSIESHAENAIDAKNNNAEISDDVLTALIKMGFERSEIQTLNYNIYPEYDYSYGRSTLKGYFASQQIIIKTNDFDKVAGVIDAGVDAGAILQSINFELSQLKQNEYKAEALKMAAEDAKIKAGAIASGSGKRLGRLVSTANNDFYYPGPLNYYSGSAESSVMDVKRVAVNIAPSDMKVTASINVQYKLGFF
ncbi:MAG: SIMPL domain-containing protein [Nanoarchaeota archaeon]